MMISIIIPAYNVEKYITGCIESVQNQNITDIEIICIDDASTDNTLPILESLSENDERIRILRHTVNSGAAKSRNDGCREARGKYISFLDADDMIKPKMLETLWAIAEENQLEVLSFSGEFFFDEDFKDKHSTFKAMNYKRNGHYEGIYKGYELMNLYYENSDFNGNLCFQFIKRDFFENNALYFNEDLRGIDDSPFAIYMAAKRAMCIPDVLYRRRYREGSQMTSAMNGIKLESIALTMFLDLVAWQSIGFVGDDYEFHGIERYFNMIYYNLREKTPNVFLHGYRYQILDKYPAAKYLLEYNILGKCRYSALSDETIVELRESKSVILYGAGIVAKRIADILKMEEVTDFTVVVSETCGDICFDGKKIYAVNDSEVTWEGAIVIVAISKANQFGVQENLKSKPVKKVIWIE